MYGILGNRVFMAVRLCLYTAIISLFILLPASFIEGRSFCVFYNLFKIKCPGCGMTRAFYNVFHVNIVQAFSYNRFVIVVFPAFIILAANDTFITCRRFIRKEHFSPQTGGSTSLVEKILLWIYR